MTTTFLLTSFVIVATPGTGAIFSLGAGISRGPRAALQAAFACTLGTLPHLVAAITGLAALLHASGVFMLMTFMVFTIYGLLAAAARDRVVRSPRVLARLRKAFAASFLALSGRLALESR